MASLHDRLQFAWDAINRRDLDEAEKLFMRITEEHPEEADGWNGLGAVCFEQKHLQNSLEYYEKALATAKAALGGSLPNQLDWGDAHRPAMRALHGIGLNKFRMGDFAGAKKAFEELLERAPDDHQGVKFLLADIAKKKDLWKKDDAA